MSEQNSTTTNEATSATPTATAPVTMPAQAVTTPPQAVNVDINSIISQAESKASEAAEKKMEAVFKSMLQQQGFDSDAIGKMTAEWRQKQHTPEQEIAERDQRIAALEKEVGEKDTTYSTKIKRRAVIDALREMKADPTMLPLLVSAIDLAAIELDEHDNVKNTDILTPLKDTYIKGFIDDTPPPNPAPQLIVTAPGHGKPTEADGDPFVSGLFGKKK